MPSEKASILKGKNLLPEVSFFPFRADLFLEGGKTIVTYLSSLKSIHLPKGIIGIFIIFVCVEVLRPSQPNGVMSSAVSLPNHTFTGQA